MLRRANTRRLHAGVLLRYFLAGIVRQHRRRDSAYDRGEENVEGNRKARMIGGEQPGRDERRGTACYDRGELVTERFAAVAQAGTEVLRQDATSEPEYLTICSNHQ